MEILGYVEMTNKGRYSRDTGEGDQTRYRPTDAFLKHFEVVSSTLPKQLIGHEDTDPIVVQVATERRMKWKDDKPKFVTIKVKKSWHTRYPMRAGLDSKPLQVAWRPATGRTGAAIN